MRFVLITMAIGAGLFAQEPRQEALSQAHALSKKIARFEDKRIAINLLTNLGRIVCKYDLPVATAVFAQAVSVLRDAGRGPADRERIRGIVLYNAARCNPGLAEQLRTLTEPEDEDPAQSVYAVLPQADALLKQDPAQAARVASSILPALPSMDEDQLWDFHSFLQDLHGEDSSQADQLYASALDQLGARPPWALLQHLGTYVFGPPGDGQYSSSTEVNGVEVFDWSAQRPGVSDEAAKSYLQAVASALWNSDTESGLRTVLAQQLAPFADKVAPQLASAFREASAGVEFDLSNQFRHSSPEELFARMAESPNPRERIQGAVFEYRMHLRQERFERASETVGRIEDPTIRAQLSRLSDIAEGIAAIREENLIRATAIAARMRPGAHQALLYLELAAARQKEDPRTAQRTIGLVWQIAGKVEPAVCSRLLLACAAQQATLEPEEALAALAEAVRSFNANPNGRRNRRRPGLRIRSNVLLEDVVGEDGWFYATIPFRFAGKQAFHFSEALDSFTTADLDRVDAIIANLQNEKLLAEAQISACELRLKHR